MKKIRSLIFIILLSSFSVHARTITISYFAVSSEPLDSPRYKAKHLLEEAYKNLAQNPQYQFHDLILNFESLPRERAIREGNSGLRDGLLMRKDNLEKEYPNLVKVNVPLVFTRLVAFTLDKSIQLNHGWDSLKSKKIAFIRGTKVIEDHIQNFPFLHPLSREESAIQMLLAKRVDVYIESPNNLKPLLKELDPKGLIYELSPPLDERPLFHYLHKKNSDLVKPLEEELLKLKAQDK